MCFAMLSFFQSIKYSQQAQVALLNCKQKKKKGVQERKEIKQRKRQRKRVATRYRVLREDGVIRVGQHDFVCSSTKTVITTDVPYVCARGQVMRYCEAAAVYLILVIYLIFRSFFSLFFSPLSLMP